jgi:hypothetical protein
MKDLQDFIRLEWNDEKVASHNIKRLAFVVGEKLEKTSQHLTDINDRHKLITGSLMAFSKGVLQMLLAEAYEIDKEWVSVCKGCGLPVIAEKSKELSAFVCLSCAETYCQQCFDTKEFCFNCEMQNK